MYFWKIADLKNDIQSGFLSEKDKFIYLFTMMLITLIGFELSFTTPSKPNTTWQIIDSVSTVIMAAIGFYWAYRANGGAAGQDFIGKSISILFVLTIRFCALLIPVILCLMTYYISTTSGEEIVTGTAVDTLPFIILQGLFYARFIKHIGDVK
ncbi:hypothetical protein [Aeromonas cavernicola]|uniref:Uncharacterized protein n=1 Tax=Aeromonas cavernicola TaxID=1006623 RepID=A0A2H9U9T4_9GAMM|nr:hypothetical protein [Aeromonas cavernicola]PJG60767.1 hypothetical protein CUC53_00015 [Aeromonas cavernicola]